MFVELSHAHMIWVLSDCDYPSLGYLFFGWIFVGCIIVVYIIVVYIVIWWRKRRMKINVVAEQIVVVYYCKNCWRKRNIDISKLESCFIFTTSLPNAPTKRNRKHNMIVLIVSNIDLRENPSVLLLAFCTK